MIQATPKADSLPPELRKHWEDSMADKFPMNQAEAIAYIQNRYMNANPMAEGTNRIRVNYQEKKPIQEAQVIPAGWSVEYEEVDGKIAYGNVGLSMSPERLVNMMNTRRTPKYMFRFTQIVLEDFRKTAIDKQLKDIKG